MRKIGQRVQIKAGGGLAIFRGRTGTIIDNRGRDGRNVMYRVRLDQAVDIPGVGPVSDDVWQGQFLQAVRAQPDHGPIGQPVHAANSKYAAPRTMAYPKWSGFGKK